MANEEPWVNNEFLQTYLQYVEHTESPQMMHIWAALSAASACMGRHVVLPFGIGDIYPNMFTLLVGPPGTRKSKAISYASKLVSQHTGVRFAPDDTSGQRQGLISAMEGDTQLSTDEQEWQILNSASSVDAMTDVGNLSISVANAADEHTIFACASEFGTFMGEGNVNMTRFLNKVWDGEDYHYKLKTSQERLRNPLMTIIGGTTTSDIARILPAESIGQGFMSRWILVFSPQKAKNVARPFLDLSLEPKLAETFAWLNYEMHGEIKESKNAATLLDYMYENKTIDLQDARFLYYAERRHTHLQKLCMVLAGLRRSFTIEEQDVETADALLAATEEHMPEALGEFGLSPIGAAKQKMLEFLQHSNEPVSASLLWQVMQRDMKLADFKSAISDLINSNKVAEVQVGGRGQAFIYKGELQEALELLGAEGL